MAENIGWREAFFIVGVPGLVLALLVRFTIDEPRRAQSEGRVDDRTRPAIATVLLGRRSFLHLALGSGLAAFNGYATSKRTSRAPANAETPAGSAPHHS